MKTRKNHFTRHPSGYARLLLSSVGVCGVVGIVGCEKKPVASPQVPVRVTELRPEQFTASTKFSGSIEPLQSTSLAFKLPGTVKDLYRPPGMDRDVQVGDTLAKGTEIAQYDEGDLRRSCESAAARVAQLESRVATAQENLQIATRNLERYDNSEGAVSKAARDDADARRVTAAGELESAQHALADAQVQLDQAKDDYANRQLIVPFENATVAEKHIEPGERKAAHEIAFRLIDISTVHINFGVPDTMVGQPAIDTSAVPRVFIGQKLPVTSDAFEGRTLTGTVTKIAPEADSRTRTFLTQLTLDNPEVSPGQRLLRPGMIVSVTVGAALDRQVRLLPMASIHQGRAGGDLVVYELDREQDKDVVHAKRVALGGVFDNRVEVVSAGSDVRDGSRIVTSTAERLADGMTVRVTQDDTNPSAAPTELK